MIEIEPKNLSKSYYNTQYYVIFSKYLYLNNFQESKDFDTFNICLLDEIFFRLPHNSPHESSLSSFVAQKL